MRHIGPSTVSYLYSWINHSKEQRIRTCELHEAEYMVFCREIFCQQAM